MNRRNQQLRKKHNYNQARTQTLKPIEETQPTIKEKIIPIEEYKKNIKDNNNVVELLNKFVNSNKKHKTTEIKIEIKTEEEASNNKNKINEMEKIRAEQDRQIKEQLMNEEMNKKQFDEFMNSPHMDNIGTIDNVIEQIIDKQNDEVKQNDDINDEIKQDDNNDENQNDHSEPENENDEQKPKRRGRKRKN